MTKRRANYEECLQKNFLDTWTHYLEFNIARHRRIVEIAGSPTRAFIAEVIYWHELLILSEKGTDELFQTVVKEMSKVGREPFARYIANKRLTISLISTMTGLPFETIRRQIKSMISSGVVELSEAYGLLINKESEFHQKCAGDLVQFEQRQIVRLIEKVINE